MKKIISKTPRTLEEKVDSLKDHLGILKDSIRYLEDGNDKYYKQVASSLRVLVYLSKTNKPLLTNIASEFKITPTVNDGTGIKKLEDYLSEAVMVIPQPVSFPVNPQNYITRIELIAKIAQQEGGAHEDDSIDNDLLAYKGELLNNPFFRIMFDGKKPHIPQLIKTGKCIYDCGVSVLIEIERFRG